VADARVQGGTGITRCDVDSFHARRLRSLPRERVLATARTDDQDLHVVYSSAVRRKTMGTAGRSAMCITCARSGASSLSMSEVSHSREHHRHAVLVGCGDHLGVAHRAAWL